VLMLLPWFVGFELVMKSFVIGQAVVIELDQEILCVLTRSSLAAPCDSILSG